jgi:hypothetical protein
MEIEALHKWLIYKGMDGNQARDIVRKIKSYNAISNSKIRMSSIKTGTSVDRILQTITDMNVMNKALQRTESLVRSIREDAANQVQHYISMIYRNWEPKVGEGLLMINWTNKEYWKSFIVDIKGNKIKPFTKSSLHDMYFSVDPDKIESIDIIKKSGVVFSMLPERELKILSGCLVEIKA